MEKESPRNQRHHHLSQWSQIHVITHHCQVSQSHLLRLRFCFWRWLLFQMDTVSVSSVVYCLNLVEPCIISDIRFEISGSNSNLLGNWSDVLEIHLSWVLFFEISCREGFCYLAILMCNSIKALRMPLNCTGKFSSRFEDLCSPIQMPPCESFHCNFAVKFYYVILSLHGAKLWNLMSDIPLYWIKLMLS